MPKEEIKFTQEELDQISEYRQKYLDVQMGFGQVEITRTRLERQHENLDTFVEDLRKQFDTIQEGEQKFIADINEKYGDGVLDPETGVFTPNSTADPKK
jgi:predicted nuclease with TOPRIM domain|tara:strand:+ start:49 stop:345 length:297 start_codon:yes stop_codon:yes gene_type:complete